jgi:hypothetical protein
MSNNDNFAIPTVYLKRHGFKQAGNTMVFDADKETNNGSKIYVSIPVEVADNFVLFGEVFVNIGSLRNSSHSIKYKMFSGNRLKLVQTFNYNNLSDGDQEKVDEIIQKVQKSLKRWDGAELDSEQEEPTLKIAA